MTMRWLPILVGWFGTVAGCYPQPEVPECQVDHQCPDHRPACIQGGCFQMSARAVVPMCSPDTVHGGVCCPLHADQQTLPSGCRLFSVVHQEAVGQVVSDPDRDRFLYTTRGARGVSLSAMDASGLRLWQHTWPEVGAGPSGIVVPDPAVGRDGTAALILDGQLVRVRSDGAIQDHPLLESQEPLIGSPAVCSTDLAAAITARHLRLADGTGWTASYALPVGSMPDSLGPIILDAGTRVLVPLEAGTEVGMLDTDTGELVWQSGTFDGGLVISAMAVTPQGRILITALGGTLHSLDAENGRTRDYWFSSVEPGFRNVGVPWPTRDAQAVYQSQSGDWFQVSARNHYAPRRIWSAPADGAFLPMREDVLARCHRKGLSFLFPLIEEETSDEARLQTVSWQIPGGCTSLSVPLPSGAMAVVQGNTIHGVVSPLQVSWQHWPTPRGIGRSGCADSSTRSWWEWNPR